MRIETLAEGVVLYNADCREVLPTLGRFDAVVTDPPYGIGESNKNFASRGKLASADKYERSNWDDKPADSFVLDWCMANSNRQIIWGGNYFGLPATSCYLVWDKLGPANDFADCELAWTNMKRAVRRIKYLWNGCMRMEKDVERVHPTQKPIEVMRWCIGFLPECHTIIDPYMGSGTSGVAAVKLGKKFTGIEIDERYFDIACRRISAALNQPDIFVEPPKPAKQEALL
jgi:DNA modification methylase